MLNGWISMVSAPYFLKADLCSNRCKLQSAPREAWCNALVYLFGFSQCLQYVEELWKRKQR